MFPWMFTWRRDIPSERDIGVMMRCETGLSGGTVRTQPVWGNHAHGGIRADDSGSARKTRKDLLRYKKHRPSTKRRINLTTLK